MAGKVGVREFFFLDVDAGVTFFSLNSVFPLLIGVGEFFF